MKKFKIISLILSISILTLTSCQEYSILYDPPRIQEIEYIGDGSSDVVPDFDFPDTFTPENSQYTFTKIVENNRLSFFSDLNEGISALADRITGVIWYTNQPDVLKNDTIQGRNKQVGMSQFIVEWFNENSVSSISTSQFSGNFKGEVSHEIIPDGIRFTYDMVNEEFKIPITYVLKDDYLQASIEPKLVEEYGSNRIGRIQFLPYMGCGKIDEDGYIMVPDGSGAIINFNNGKNYTYTESIYGRDSVIAKQQETTISPEIKLPVFGIKKESGGLLGIIDGSAAKSGITAGPSNSSMPYNYIHPYYNYRSVASVTLATMGYRTRTVSLMEKQPDTNQDFRVLYYPLVEEESGYVGMAKKYNRYFVKRYKITNQDDNFNSVPDILINFQGYVKDQKSILGMPVIYDKVLTNFSDIAEIAEHFSINTDITPAIRMTGWIKNGQFDKIPTSAKPAASLGGKKEYTDMVKTLDELGIDFYPSVDLLRIYKDGRGFSSFLDSARSVTNSPFTQFTFMKNLFYRNLSGEYWRYLSPGKALDFFSEFNKNYSKISNDHLALEYLGSNLYSDFGTSYSGRNHSQFTFEKALSDWDTSGMKIMVDSPSAYSFPYVSIGVNVETDSGMYFSFDKSVPFYQISVSGLFPITTTPINLAAEPKLLFLKSIETGMIPMFSLINEDSTYVKNTSLVDLYSAGINDWLPYIEEYGEKIKELHEKTGNTSIINHIQIADDIFETVYENNVSVVVNYSEYEYTHNGITIPAEDYRVY